MTNKIVYLNSYDIFMERIIDKSSPTPIYHQIQQIIHNIIETKKLNVGNKIPTEDELYKIFNISRMDGTTKIIIW